MIIAEKLDYTDGKPEDRILWTENSVYFKLCPAFSINLYIDL